MKYSIEFAHVYTDGSFMSSALESAEVVKSLTAGQVAEPHQLCIMIDDYSPKEMLDFDKDAFRGHIANHLPAETEFETIYESELLDLCDKTLEIINDNQLRKKYSRYIASRRTYPCSLFIAAFYLLRLGMLELHGRGVEPAEHLINVLPKDHRENERLATKLIDSVQAGLSDKIDNIYIS